jgi:predicted acyl esterase
MVPGQVTSDRIWLMEGPWYHVSDFDGLHLNTLQLRWFDHWLKDDSTAAVSGPPFTFQAIGSSRWFHAHEYPLSETRRRVCTYREPDACPSTPPRTSPRRHCCTPRGPIAGRSLRQGSLGTPSFVVLQRGSRIRYDLDNRRLQPEALTHTTEPFTSPKLVAGPITLTVQATATTSETLWVADLDDVSPDGTSRPLTQRALLRSLRALDPSRTWTLSDGTVLRPDHISTRSAAQPVIPGELTRYGHRGLSHHGVDRHQPPASPHPEHLRLPPPSPHQARAGCWRAGDINCAKAVRRRHTWPSRSPTPTE